LGFLETLESDDDTNYALSWVMIRFESSSLKAGVFVFFLGGTRSVQLVPLRPGSSHGCFHTLDRGFMIESSMRV
jgi:hypothetical protein